MLKGNVKTTFSPISSYSQKACRVTARQVLRQGRTCRSLGCQLPWEPPRVQAQGSQWSMSRWTETAFGPVLGKESTLDCGCVKVHGLPLSVNQADAPPTRWGPPTKTDPELVTEQDFSTWRFFPPSSYIVMFSHLGVKGPEVDWRQHPLVPCSALRGGMSVSLRVVGPQCQRDTGRRVQCWPLSASRLCHFPV